MKSDIEVHHGELAKGEFGDLTLGGEESFLDLLLIDFLWILVLIGLHHLSVELSMPGAPGWLCR